MKGAKIHPWLHAKGVNFEFQYAELSLHSNCGNVGPEGGVVWRLVVA